MASDRSVRVWYEPSGGTDEILRPTLVVVNGRSYRKLTETTFGKRRNAGDEAAVLEERRGMYTTDDVYDEGEDTSVELEGVEQTSSGGYMLKLSIPSVFFKYIIGKEGRTKANIEKETRCRMRIPSRGTEGDLVLEGPFVSCLADAKRRVEIVVWTNRIKEPPTHFISIPLNIPAIMERLVAFRDVVLASCHKDRGISLAVFQVPAKLHLTLGVMRLFSTEEEERAKDVLKMAIQKAVPLLGSEPAVISLHGVECMKDDPSAVDILYVKVYLTDGSNRLQGFVDALVSHFLEEAPDLMNREFEREGVKLHATVMNSKFPHTSADSSGAIGTKGSHERGGYRRHIPRESFDARRIFKDLGDFNFGQTPLDRVHLSKRKEYGPNGYYTCIQEYSIKKI